MQRVRIHQTIKSICQTMFIYFVCIRINEVYDHSKVMISV